MTYQSSLFGTALLLLSIPTCFLNAQTVITSPEAGYLATQDAGQITAQIDPRTVGHVPVAACLVVADSQPLTES